MKKFSRGAIAFVMAAMLASGGSDCMAGWRRGRCPMPAMCDQPSEGARAATVREPTLAPPRAPLPAAQGTSARQQGVVYITVEVAPPGK